jgi:hypothetical protein
MLVGFVKQICYTAFGLLILNLLRFFITGRCEFILQSLSLLYEVVITVK